jgi:hypothetical protein
MWWHIMMSIKSWNYNFPPSSYIIRNFRPTITRLAICFHAGILAGLFDPEDGGDMFFETSVDIQRTTLRYIPEDSTLHNHRCENLKSNNAILFANQYSRKNWNLTFVSICFPKHLPSFNAYVLKFSLARKPYNNV